jgi:hypothetical protein
MQSHALEAIEALCTVDAGRVCQVELLLICAGDEGNAIDVNAFYSTFILVSHPLSSCCVLLAGATKHTQYRF